jgi:hypothetical protein
LLICQPFVDAAEKLKGPYKMALAEYEQRKKGQSGDKADSESAEESAEPTPPAKTKSTPAKGGFTAIKAAPLAANPGSDSVSEDDTQDEAAVAADLGGSQPSSVSPARRQKRDGGSVRKEKTKEKDKDKKKRRKSSTREA